MRRLLVLALLPLVACASPQERCISGATKDIRVMDRLIKTTRGNLERGYAIGKETYTVETEQVCGELDGEDLICTVPESRERKVPVAVDLNAEKAKLTSLLDKRASLISKSEQVIRACRAHYPES